MEQQPQQEIRPVPHGVQQPAAFPTPGKSPAGRVLGFCALACALLVLCLILGFFFGGYVLGGWYLLYAPIASTILALSGLVQSIISLVLCRGRPGKGPAVAALCICIVVLALFVLLAAAFIFGSAGYGPTD